MDTNELVEQVLFVEKLPKYFTCPICLEYIRQCVMTSCHHKFCASCLQDSLKARDSCPVCRTDVKSEEIKHDQWMDKQIKSLCTYCHKREDGCLWQGDLSELNDHILKSCEYSTTPCPNRCGKILLWKNLEEHFMDCDYRLVPCEFCHSQVPLALKPDHLEANCKSYKTPCPHCQCKVLKFSLAEHIKTECPNFEISCPFGCVEKFLRSNSLHHNDKNMHFHNQILLERVLKLESENKILKSVTVPFGVVSNGSIHLGQTFPSDTLLDFTWRIDIREIKHSIQHRDPIHSPTFSIMNTSWIITLKIKETCHLRLRLVTTNQVNYIYDIHWEYEMVNHKKEKSNILLACSHEYYLPENDDRMSSEIIPLQGCPFTDYISDPNGMVIHFRVLSLTKKYCAPTDRDAGEESVDDEIVEFFE